MAQNPAPAKRLTRSSMCGTSPHHSWMTTTAGLLPDSGAAKYPWQVWLFDGNSTRWPICWCLLGEGRLYFGGSVVVDRASEINDRKTGIVVTFGSPTPFNT